MEKFVIRENQQIIFEKIKKITRKDLNLIYVNRKECLSVCIFFLIDSFNVPFSWFTQTTL